MRKYKLKEISSIYNGSTPSTSDVSNYDGDIIWITPKDLSNQKSKYISKGERNITEKGYKLGIITKTEPEKQYEVERALYKFLRDFMIEEGIKTPE